MTNCSVVKIAKLSTMVRAFGLRRKTVLCAGLALTSSLSLIGQNSQRLPLSQSELARQNMERVSASVGQLVAILHRDPGIMVELKRWIAKDATEHGQLISDSDLTDEAIFDRLESDIAFRSVATTLVQRYGFLQPTYNPESPEAQQQQFLIRERAKYIAQDEEFSRQAQRKQRERELQQTQLCDPETSSCKNQSAKQNPSIQALPQDQPGMNGLPDNAPETLPSLPPAAPSTPTMPSNDVASLLRTSSGDSLDQFSADGTASAMSSSGANAQGRNQQNQIDDLSLGSDFSLDASNSHLPDTPHSESALASGSVSPSEATASNSDLTNSADSWKQRQARESIGPTQRLVRRNNPYEQIPSLYDMYLQAAAKPPSVDRFGMQIFQNGTRDLQMIPMDLPVGPDYVLGPGDGISIDLWGGVARRFYQAVDREGRVSLPEVGPLLVAGKSLAEVQQAVQKTLRTQFRDVSADVSLS
ncbi:MAG TPA: polysaccharide biosynthesis/export family protein, partial [Nitrospira sp.]|nr:polysaccharide biosynthesis/export family protein [Nitrospira sp.]